MKKGTRRIKLTQGKFAIVDAIDYEHINQWKWHAEKTKHRRSRSVWYASRGFMLSGKQFNVRIHQEIAKRLNFPRGDCDHRNLDGLDNRRENLRPCTQSQNNGNRAKWPGCSSRFKGCWWDPKRRTWIVKIMKDGISYHIGRFKSEYQAGLAYLEAAEILFAEFARAK